MNKWRLGRRRTRSFFCKYIGFLARSLCLRSRILPSLRACLVTDPFLEAYFSLLGIALTLTDDTVLRLVILAVPLRLPANYVRT